MAPKWQGLTLGGLQCSASQGLGASPRWEQRVGCRAGTLLLSLLLKEASALAVLFRSRGVAIMAEIAK